MDSTIKLYANAYVKNSYGVDVPTETKKEVFCEVRSITSQEFFMAGRNGLNPAYLFIVFAADYEGEVIAEYEGKLYSIYRTFKPDSSDYIELYAERKGGSNG